MSENSNFGPSDDRWDRLAGVFCCVNYPFRVWKCWRTFCAFQASMGMAAIRAWTSGATASPLGSMSPRSRMPSRNAASPVVSSNSGASRARHSATVFAIHASGPPAAAKELEPDVRLLKLNSDAEPAAASVLGVSGIPALFLIRDGKVVAQTAGAMPASQIVSWARQALAKSAA